MLLPGTGSLTLDRRTVYYQTRANFGAALHGAEVNLGHGGYRSESLPAETHSVKRKQVGSLRNLACGVTFKRQTGIRVTHSAAVVNHLNQRPSCILHNHLDRLHYSEGSPSPESFNKVTPHPQSYKTLFSTPLLKQCK